MAHVTLDNQPDIGWEKPQDNDLARRNLARGGSERWKFMIGGLLILGSVAYLVISGTLTGARFFITVDEVVTNPAYIGDTVRLSGAVLGDTIEHNIFTDDATGSEVSQIRFTVANIPEQFEDLAETLHQSVSDPAATRLQVVFYGDFPDLLQHEAQAILTGELGSDGIFYASELLLKCPSRFEEGNPDSLLDENHQTVPIDES